MIALHCTRLIAVFAYLFECDVLIFHLFSSFFRFWRVFFFSEKQPTHIQYQKSSSAKIK